MLWAGRIHSFLFAMRACMLACSFCRHNTRTTYCAKPYWMCLCFYEDLFIEWIIPLNDTHIFYTLIKLLSTSGVSCSSLNVKLVCLRNCVRTSDHAGVCTQRLCGKIEIQQHLTIDELKWEVCLSVQFHFTAHLPSSGKVKDLHWKEFLLKWFVGLMILFVSKSQLSWGGNGGQLNLTDWWMKISVSTIDKLKRRMQSKENRIADNNRYTNHINAPIEIMARWMHIKYSNNWFEFIT